MSEDVQESQGKNDYPQCEPEEVLSRILRGEEISKVSIQKELNLGGIREGNESKTRVYKEPVIIRDAVIQKLNLEGALFEKNLVLERVTVQKTLVLEGCQQFSGSVRFRECTFEKGATFKDAVFNDICLYGSDFQGPVKWANTKFKGEIDGCRVNFGQGLTVEQCEFEKGANLSSCTFSGDTTWRICRFHDALNLKRSRWERGKILNCEFIKAFALSEAEISQKFECCANHFYGPAIFDNAIFHNNFIGVNNLFHNFAKFDQVRFERQVSFGNSEFERDANFNRSMFLDNFSFKEVQVRGDANFREAVFKGPASFKSTRFFLEANFQFAHFFDGADFTFAEFQHLVSFSPANFDKELNFYRSVCRGPAFFLGTKFHDVFFVNSTFEGQAFFSHDKHTIREYNRMGKKEDPLKFVSIFDGQTLFTNTLFSRKTVFENVFFKEYANFENVHFGEEINFEKTHFLKGAKFKGAFCAQDLNFTHAVFGGSVNFNLASIGCRLNLTNTTINHGISFYHAVIDVVVVEQDQIAGRLFYEGKLPGTESHKNYTRVKEEYLTLKESFHQRGKFDEEDWAYYQYRVYDRKFLTAKAWYSLLGKWTPPVWDEDELTSRKDGEGTLQAEENGVHKARTTLTNKKKKMDELLQKPEPKSESHKLYLESPDYQKKVDTEVAKLREDIKDEEKTLTELEKKRDELKELVDMDKNRLQSISKNQDKSFTCFQSLMQLLKSGFWKVVDWGTGYGVKPFRIAFLALAVILIFASIYLASGVEFPFYSSENQTSVSQVKPSFIYSVLNWIHFSTMSFTTTNPVESIAYNPKIKFFIMFETLIGVFLMALFVGCYTRKILR